jgi:transcriptional regulator with XRE-family HTH domain
MTPLRLKRLRKHLNLTQQQLADRLGVDRNTVNRWEMGMHPINSTAEKLLKMLDGEQWSHSQRK